MVKLQPVCFFIELTFLGGRKVLDCPSRSLGHKEGLMIQILVGTDRLNSRSLQVARFIEPMYQCHGFKTHIMELSEVGIDELNGTHYGEKKPEKVALAVDQLMKSEGLIIVCPEYNGSMPGALKYFIDHWKYPESFEHRPFCFIGLGGRFGGVRPVEHLQQIFWLS